MKEFIVMSLILAGPVLAAGTYTPCDAQVPAKADAPTFYHLVPGTYVNGWPRFTIHYPKDWVEVLPRPDMVFRAAAPPGSTPRAALDVVVAPWPLPLDKIADADVRVFRRMAANVTVESKKLSRLRDGTPALEVELYYVVNGEPRTYFDLATKRDDMVIHAGIGSPEKIGEDLKAIPYSIEFQPGFDEPVKVPSDVREFLDKLGNDMLTHDLVKVLSHYSDRYLNSGVRKGGGEQAYQIRRLILTSTSCEIVPTDFVPEGNRAYVAGFFALNAVKATNSEISFAGKKDLDDIRPFGRVPIKDTSIIKENGMWKWYGNQRDASP